jgi:outer membrane protein assembly factor BamB
VNFKSWAAGLVVAMLAAGCGGGGGGSSSAPLSVSITPTSATLSAMTTDKAPTATIALSTVEGPNGRLTVVPANGSKGYVTATFDGTNVVLTGEAPSALAAGTYQDTVSVKVCLDSQCANQVTNSPFSVPVTYTVTAGNPAVATPAITALSPTSASVGGAAFTLIVSGNNFTQTSVVMWNGQPRTTTYVAAATLDAQITAADVAALTTASITVSNAASGGGVSAAQSFAVAPVVPAITALSPTTATMGGSDYTLTVTGTGFDSSAQVNWNGSPVVTTFVSATALTAVIPAADIAKTGSFPVSVWNADGSPHASSPMQVSVVLPPLALGSLVPPFVTAGGTAYVETVNGTGFTTNSVAQLNGSPRTTTFVSTTRLQMQVTAADIASVGTTSVTVADGTTTPTVTSALTLTIGANTASIDATAFNVNPQHNGAIRFANIVASGALPTAPTWSVTLDGVGSYPVIAGGKVFLTEEISYNHSELVALNAASGAVVWGPITIAGNSAATYDNGRVIVLSNTVGSPGIMTAYDASTGTVLWRKTLPTQYLFSDPPTASNGMVYVGGAGSGGTLYALDDTNGTIMWSASVMNGDNSSPTVTASGVYVSYPCVTQVFNPATGTGLWSNSQGCEGGGGATGAWANGIYYSPNGVAGYGGMAFNATSGTFLTSYTATQPVAIGSSIGYFLQNAKLSALSLADSSVQWTFTGDGNLTTAPLLVNSYVFVGSSSGKLYALDASTGAQLAVIPLVGAPNTSNLGNVVSWNGMNAGDGLLVVPTGNKLSAFTLSTNP